MAFIVHIRTRNERETRVLDIEGRHVPRWELENLISRASGLRRGLNSSFRLILRYEGVEEEMPVDEFIPANSVVVYARKRL